MRSILKVIFLVWNMLMAIWVGFNLFVMSDTVATGTTFGIWLVLGMYLPLWLIVSLILGLPVMVMRK